MRSDLIAQINTESLVHNYRTLRSRLAPGVKFCAPLKADAYGHGIEVVAPELFAAGADLAAVATIQEAIELRGLVWRRPILVLGGVLAVADAAERRERLGAIDRHNLSLSIVDLESFAVLTGSQIAKPIDVHLKVDTGMGRMGIMPAEGRTVIERVLSNPHLRLAGIYSHFASADLAQPDLARRQLAAFKALLSQLADILPAGALRHMANSAATICMPEAHFDMVRPGLALYGYLPSNDMADKIALRPILRLVSHLSAVKDLPAGHCVGYGQTFTTRRPTRLGIVPAGYSDGYLRCLSNTAFVTTPQGPAPVVGRISMDQFAVDLTDLAPLSPGAEITLISDDPGHPNSVARLAEAMRTIPYEVTCLLGRRIQRVQVGKSCAAASAVD